MNRVPETMVCSGFGEIFDLGICDVKWGITQAQPLPRCHFADQHNRARRDYADEDALVPGMSAVPISGEHHSLELSWSNS